MDHETTIAVRDALAALSAAPVDTGAGPDGVDFWVTIGGTEYMLTARRSNRQLQRDALNGETMQ